MCSGVPAFNSYQLHHLAAVNAKERCVKQSGVGEIEKSEMGLAGSHCVDTTEYTATERRPRVA